MKKWSALAKTFSMAAASLWLIGCDDFPDVRFKLVKHSENRYLEHVLVDKKKLTFRADKWVTGLEKLNANYCITAREAGDLLDYARRRSTEKSSFGFQTASLGDVLGAIRIETPAKEMIELPASDSEVEIYLNKH